MEEFISQIQLIWDNCKLYNMIGSQIYKICEKIEKSYNRDLSKFRAAQGLNANNSSSAKRNIKTTPQEANHNNNSD